jgi:signal transduction histidine kinase
MRKPTKLSFYKSVIRTAFIFLFILFLKFSIYSQSESFNPGISSPWYSSWWAYAIYIILFGLLIFSIDRFQRRRLIKKERYRADLLNRIGKDLTGSLDSDTIFYKLYENVNKLLDASIFGVGIYHSEKQEIEYRLAIEKGKKYEPYSRDMKNKNQFPVWCIENRKPVFINDIIKDKSKYIEKYDDSIEANARLEDGSYSENPQSLIYLPLIAKEQVLGIITIQSFKKNAYTNYHLSLLQNLAGYTTIALDNANAYLLLNNIRDNLEIAVKERTAEIQTQKDNIEQLSEIGKEITASLVMDTIFMKLYEHVNKLIDATVFGVGVYHPDSEQIEYRLAIEKGKKYEPYTRDMSDKDQFSVWCIENEKSVFINDVEVEYDRYINKYVHLGGQLEDGSFAVNPLSMIYLPLIAQDRVLGVITVQSYNKNAYEKYHLQILQNLANYTAIALENARLFEEVEEARSAAMAADEAKSTFLSTVSHELRTPLTSVVGFAKIIKKRLNNRLFPLIQTEDAKIQRTIEQVAGNLDVVVSEGERLTTLINEVLDLAKIEAGRIDWKMENLEISEILERAIAATSSLFTNKKLELIKEFNDILPKINGDRDRLIQVVINLLSNAVKFTDVGSVTCAAKLSNNEIVVSISDTGDGISPDNQKKVFEKFKQVGDTMSDRPKGTGLGLPICKEIVEHHGGKIWVESEIGKGSTFSFSLQVEMT